MNKRFTRRILLGQDVQSYFRRVTVINNNSLPSLGLRRLGKSANAFDRSREQVMVLRDRIRNELQSGGLDINNAYIINERNCLVIRIVEEPQSNAPGIGRHDRRMP